MLYIIIFIMKTKCSLLIYNKEIVYVCFKYYKYICGE